MLTDSARAVLRALATTGPATRPHLSARLNLSKPTASMAIAELGARGLVARHGEQRGATGRTAVLYGLGAAAGHVIGLDAGRTHVRAMALSLDGRHLAAAEAPAPGFAPGFAPGPGPGSAPWSLSRVAPALAAAAATVRRGLSERHGPLRAITAALPTIVPRTHGTDALAADVASLRQAVGAQGVPLLLENNVNGAAFAELHRGAARGRDGFAYLQVGVKIGLGIVHERRLYRGAHGGAGEVGRLPFPWSPEQTPHREGLEHYLGSEQFFARALAPWPRDAGPRPDRVEDLFRLAAAGHGPALSAVERHADDIGRLVSACIGVLDPGLVVLGGGVGQNGLIVERVRRAVDELTWPTDIAVTALGAGATVLGAALLAAEYSLGQLLGETMPSAPMLDATALEPPLAAE